MTKTLTKTAKVYKTDGSVETIEYNSKNRLEKFQKAVGGLIQPLTIKVKGQKAFTIVLNEEGLLLDLPFNRWSHFLTKGSVWEYNPFYGNILVLDSVMR